MAYVWQVLFMTFFHQANIHGTVRMQEKFVFPRIKICWHTSVKICSLTVYWHGASLLRRMKMQLWQASNILMFFAKAMFYILYVNNIYGIGTNMN
jgi:hypothetical protein